MTLAQLRYAICVADTHSMNEASRSLFISQPSLSTSIKELENEIGLELFKRTNRGVTVTPEGEEFLGYARQVVEQLDIRKKYKINIMALKEDGRMDLGITPGTLLGNEATMLVLGNIRDIERCFKL